MPSCTYGGIPNRNFPGNVWLGPRKQGFFCFLIEGYKLVIRSNLGGFEVFLGTIPNRSHPIKGLKYFYRAIESMGFFQHMVFQYTAVFSKLFFLILVCEIYRVFSKYGNFRGSTSNSKLPWNTLTINIAQYYGTCSNK